MTNEQKEREAIIIEKWMEFLVHDDSKQILKTYEEDLREQHSELLREMGEVHVRQVEDINPRVYADRQSLISDKLTCIEIFLLLIDCMRRKLLFLSQLLNPATPDEQIQAALPYQQLLEKIVVVERQRLNLKPRPLEFPWDKYPYKALAMVCFP